MLPGQLTGLDTSPLALGTWVEQVAAAALARVQRRNHRCVGPRLPPFDFCSPPPLYIVHACMDAHAGARPHSR
eukprot:5072412-Prymnesium_polylepis.3